MKTSKKPQIPKFAQESVQKQCTIIKLEVTKTRRKSAQTLGNFKNFPNISEVRDQNYN